MKYISQYLQKLAQYNSPYDYSVLEHRLTDQNSVKSRCDLCNKITLDGHSYVCDRRSKLGFYSCETCENDGTTKRSFIKVFNALNQFPILHQIDMVCYYCEPLKRVVSGVILDDDKTIYFSTQKKKFVIRIQSRFNVDGSRLAENEREYLEVDLDNLFYFTPSFYSEWLHHPLFDVGYNKIFLNDLSSEIQKEIFSSVDKFPKLKYMWQKLKLEKN